MTFLRFPINIRRRNFGLKKNDEVKTIEPEALVILKWKKRVERERERENESTGRCIFMDFFDIE